MVEERTQCTKRVAAGGQASTDDGEALPPERSVERQDAERIRRECSGVSPKHRG